MKYKDALNLFHGDEVTVKKTNSVLMVLSVVVEDKNAFVYCSDGNSYHHKEIK
jgi:hypothetical protein